MKLIFYLTLLGLLFVQIHSQEIEESEEIQDSDYVVTPEDIAFQHAVCENPELRTTRTHVALEEFDSRLNGGEEYITVIMSVFSGCNPGRVDLPAFANIATQVHAKFPNVVFLVSAKGGGACQAWHELSNQTTEWPLIVEDTDRRLHYMYFDYHPQFVVLDQAMNVQYKFGSTELSSLPVYISELLQKPIQVPEQDCKVSAWSPFSECSTTCGSGTKERTRIVTSAGNGLCPSLLQQEACSMGPCKLPGTKASSCADLFGSDPQVSIVATNKTINLGHITDIKFHPLSTNEIWLSDKESDRFVVLEIDNKQKLVRGKHLRDRHPYHYMDQISGFDFGGNTSFVATCQGSLNTYDGRMVANNFQGPTLYDTDPKWLVSHMNEHLTCGSDGLYGIRGDPVECYLTHHDMLHEAPMCMGIAFDPETKSPFHHVYWAFAGKDRHLVRFDFEKPHGPGSMDHALASVRRYPEVELTHDPEVPGHMHVDHEHRQMYIADTGKNRVLVFDLESSEYREDARVEYPVFSSQEPTFEYSIWGCSDFSEFARDLKRPSGVVVTNTTVYISEYDTGKIHAYVKRTGEFVQAVDTNMGPGLTSLTLSPQKDAIWFTHTNVKEGSSVGRIDIGDKKCPGTKTGANDAHNMKNAVRSQSELCKTEAKRAPMTPVFEHEPGYMNMSGISDEYTNANCDDVNYDAILLNGYFCHKCLRNPCANNAPCVDHRFVGYTCNCDAIRTSTTQFVGDKCQTSVHCETLSSKSCAEIGFGAQCKERGNPLVCGFSKAVNAVTLDGLKKVKKGVRKASQAGTCFGLKNFKQAKKICEMHGARLCTATELKDGEAAGTGCNLDNKRVWLKPSSSSIKCVGGRGVSAAGTGDTLSEKCERPKVRRNVRCCADAETTSKCPV